MTRREHPAGACGRRPCLGVALALAVALAPLPACPAEHRTLRVGTSGDYAPFSVASARDGRTLAGFDVAVARAYAAERGLRVEFVRFRWPDLLRSLEEGRFDVAMSGVTVRPERSAHGRFTVTVAESGAVVLVRDPERWQGLDDLDRPAARLGVNAGGHLEAVARDRFPLATVVALADNAEVRRALGAGWIDAAVTDTLEAPSWRRGSQGWAVLGPFTRDRKAYLVRPDRPDLARELDAWLLARERDGRLDRLRREHLGEAAGTPLATPLAALLAAIDERLSLMPLIARAKDAAGLPAEDPAREAIVVDAALANVRKAAGRAGVPPPPDAAVRALVRAEIEAGKEIQAAALRSAAAGRPPPPDLARVLRPALERIDERIARLVVALPPGLETGGVLAAAGEAVRTPGLPEAGLRAIADAVVGCAPARPRASLPGPDGPDVQVDEAGTPVVADAAPPERHRGLTELPGVHVGHPYVDGHPLHVETVLGDPAVPPSQPLVGGRRAVARDHLDGRAAPREDPDVVEEVEQAGIDRVDIARAVVPQELVDPAEGVGYVPAVGPVDDGEPEVRLGVEERQALALGPEGEALQGGEEHEAGGGTQEPTTGQAARGPGGARTLAGSAVIHQ
jgi:cyclohexadienyl dehydratase